MNTYVNTFTCGAMTDTTDGIYMFSTGAVTGISVYVYICPGTPENLTIQIVIAIATSCSRRQMHICDMYMYTYMCT